MNIKRKFVSAAMATVISASSIFAPKLLAQDATKAHEKKAKTTLIMQGGSYKNSKYNPVGIGIRTKIPLTDKLSAQGTLIGSMLDGEKILENAKIDLIYKLDHSSKLTLYARDDLYFTNTLNAGLEYSIKNTGAGFEYDHPDMYVLFAYHTLRAGSFSFTPLIATVFDDKSFNCLVGQLTVGYTTERFNPYVRVKQIDSFDGSKPNLSVQLGANIGI